MYMLYIVFESKLAKQAWRQHAVVYYNGNTANTVNVINVLRIHWCKQRVQSLLLLVLMFFFLLHIWLLTCLRFR